MPEEDSIVPVRYEVGEDQVASAEARQLLDRVKERSPVQIFGKDLLEKTAAELSRACPNTPAISAFQLALKLRGKAWIIREGLAATVRSDADFESDDLLDPEGPSSEKGSLKPNAILKKAAKKKLKQADDALTKAFNLLQSDELAAFTNFDEDSATSLKDEISRMSESIETPIGLRRGHPFVASSVKTIHQVFFDLTGKRLRGGRDSDRRDEPLENLIFSLLRQITPHIIHDEAIWSSIETQIKKPKPRS